MPDWEFEKAIPSEKSGTWERWFCEENLQLPIHQIKAIHPHTDEFEFFLNERDHSHWASRRHEGLTRPVEEVLGRSDTGIPFLAPEIQLLFKAKYTRPKDQSDFDLSLTQLRAAQRHWLVEELRQYHPAHPWISALETSAML